MLHLDLFKSFVGDFAEHYVLAVGCIISTTDDLRWCLCRLGTDFAGLATTLSANRIRRVLHLVLRLHLLIHVLLLLVIDNRLVWFKVLANPLIYRLFSNFVIIARLDFDHVFKIVDIATIELRILRIGAGPASSELLMNVDACVALGFTRDLERRLVGWLDKTALWVLLGRSARDD